MVHPSQGLACPPCHSEFEWRDLDYRIIPDGDGGLLWQFSCPICGQVLRTDTFSFPADFSG